MLIDELREQLKATQQDVAAISSYWQNSKLEDSYQTLHARTLVEEFWQAKDQIEVSRQLQKVKEKREAYLAIMQQYNECTELIELFADNEEELRALKKEMNSLQRNVANFKISLLLSGERDASYCYLSINAGAGGTESQDWASMLLRMYIRFCERENFKADIMDYQAGEEAGIKSATLYIRGDNAYGLLKGEIGIHRLVRISPFDASKRRHTSFAAVAITPEVPEEKIEINPDELRIDTYRAGGAGGQHVNKTDSAVRITHIPSGIVVQCQNERSQFQNKQAALKMLMAKLVEQREEEARAREAAVKKQKIEWGSQIRSYVLHPYKMVKDHRTDFESPQPDLVLDGGLMPFIENFLTEFAAHG
jgi:peptide chain release factor 2